MHFFKRRINIDELEKKQDISGLIRALGDNNVAYSAHNALARIGKPAVNPLIAVLQNDKNYTIRCLAADALGDIGDLNAIEPLITALNDEDHNVRLHAAHALGKFRDPRTISPLISAFTRKSNPVYDAAKVLATWGIHEAIEPLIAALQHNDSSVRLNAAIALGKFRDPRAISPLISAFTRKSNPVYKAADVLATWGVHEAIEPLIAALQHDDTGVRHCAAEALGELGDPRAIEPLKKVLKDGNSRVNDAVAEALKKLGVTNVDSLLVELKTRPKIVVIDFLDDFSDKDLDKYFVEVNIPSVENTQAILPLLDAIKDYRHGEDSRARAARELGKIGGKEAITALRSALTDHSVLVHTAVLEAIKATNLDPVDVIAPALISWNSDLVAAASNTLAEIGGDKAITTLKAALKKHRQKLQKLKDEGYDSYPGGYPDWSDRISEVADTISHIESILRRLMWH